MSRGVNKVILIGTLGRDPEVRYTPKGSAVTRVSLATHEQWKDKQTGEKHERTEWHRVVFLDRQAEKVAEYVKKGQQLYVEGRLQTRKWKEKSGREHHSTEIIAGEMQMLDEHHPASPASHSAPAQTGDPGVPGDSNSNQQDDDLSDIPF